MMNHKADEWDGADSLTIGATLPQDLHFVLRAAAGWRITKQRISDRYRSSQAFAEKRAES